jgi:hypothetical protein
MILEEAEQYVQQAEVPQDLTASTCTEVSVDNINTCCILARIAMSIKAKMLWRATSCAPCA